MRKVQTAALTAASLLVFCGYYSLGDACLLYTSDAADEL